MIKRDIENNKKRKLEKKLSIFEIFVLVISIVAFSYLIGEEFRLVSAGGREAQEILKNPEIIEEAEIVTVPGGAGAISPTSGLAESGTVAPMPSATPTPTSSPMTFPEEYITGASSEAGVPATPAYDAAAAEAAASTQPAAAAAAQKAAQAAWTRFWSATGNAALQILSNLGTAFTLYTATKYIASLFDANPEAARRLALTTGIVYFSASTVATLVSYGYSLAGATAPTWLFTKIWIFSFSLPALILTGIVVLGYLLFGDLNIIIDEYKFTCYPWQPEGEGANCEECNKGDFECNRYKCESLGASCQFLRNEKFCYWHNRNDNTAPVISPWLEPLDEEKYKYDPLPTTLPSERGVEIKDKTSTDGCIGAATRLTFGVTLDELAECRVSTNRTETYQQMTEIPELTTGYSVYDHTITSLHNWGIALLEGQTIPFREDGKYEIFVRCMNTNDLANDGTFVFKYCVKDTPDVTAATVEFTTPENNKPVQYGTTSIGIDVYLDKPVECKWSHNDQDYEAMTETMDCTDADTPEEAILFNMNMFYKCTTTLTGLKDQTANKFYFMCNSHPEYDNEDPDDPETNRQVNSQSYVYTLIGTRPLVIDSVTPKSGAVIKDSTQSVKVTVQARTSAGYKDGEATCFIKRAAAQGRGKFTNTDSYQHSVDLWLPRGSYGYSIECCDSGGNCDTETTEFVVDTDFSSPAVVRAYNEGASLKIVTNEEAECVYDTTSCSYSFDDGIAMTSSDNINHFTEWNTDNNFYIKCQDDFGNQPTPDGCSIIVRPSDY